MKHCAPKRHPGMADEELASRLAKWQRPENVSRSGYAYLYHNHVEGADTGTDLDFLRRPGSAALGRESH